MGTSPDLRGDKRHVVAISDVHLGTDHPCVWYQRDLHEPYLLALLDWVVDQADHVRELVLLGDIVDFWTYPMEEVPPTFADIAATHPRIFGLDGALARVLDALEGAVTYVPGNHDQGITAAEVASIASPGGHAVRLVTEVPHQPSGPDGEAAVAFAHGHHFTLFNAPTAVGPWAPLPIGYFITRAVASRWRRDLEAGATVADLADQDAPNGLDLAALRTTLAGATSRSVAGTLVDFVVGATGVDPTAPIAMPDGSTATLATAREAYVDCWSDWSDAHGGGIIGQSTALRAALADFDGSCLGWFAQRLALRHGADLVVMGHTHVPVGGLEAGLVDYVNTGFDCPSGPDMARPGDAQQVTFAVVDGAEAEAQLWAVSADDGDLRCHPIEAPTQPVTLRPGTDYSCYVVVEHHAGEADLVLVSAEATDGTFVVDPPARIAAGSEGRFWLQDLVGVAGSAGTATYRVGDDGPEVVLAFACPTVGTNRCSGTEAFATASGSDPWRDHRVAHWGHPFFVHFEVR